MSNSLYKLLFQVTKFFYFVIDINQETGFLSKSLNVIEYFKYNNSKLLFYIYKTNNDTYFIKLIKY